MVQVRRNAIPDSRHSGTIRGDAYAVKRHGAGRPVDRVWVSRRNRAACAAPLQVESGTAQAVRWIACGYPGETGRLAPLRYKSKAARRKPSGGSRVGIHAPGGLRRTATTTILFASDSTVSPAEPTGSLRGDSKRLLIPRHLRTDAGEFVIPEWHGLSVFKTVEVRVLGRGMYAPCAHVW
jgi:hypothetical protein